MLATTIYLPPPRHRPMWLVRADGLLLYSFGLSLDAFAALLLLASLMRPLSPNPPLFSFFFMRLYFCLSRVGTNHPALGLRRPWQLPGGADGGALPRGGAGAAHGHHGRGLRRGHGHQARPRGLRQAALAATAFAAAAAAAVAFASAAASASASATGLRRCLGLIGAARMARTAGVCRCAGDAEKVDAAAQAAIDGSSCLRVRARGVSVVVHLDCGDEQVDS